VQATASRIDVFLRAVDTIGEPVVFELASVRARATTGELEELELSRLEVDSEVARTRLELAGGVVTPRDYDALVLVLARAWRGQGAARQELRLVPPEAAGPRAPLDPLEGLVPGDEPAALEVVVPLDVQVARRRAVSVFLDWSVEPSLLDDRGFSPVFATQLARPQVRFSLLYVTDPVGGTLRAVDRRTGEVVGSAKVGAAPSAVAVSRAGFDAYVANRLDGSVSFVDTRRYIADVTVPIRLGAETADIVIADRGRTVVTANRGLDNVSVIDLVTSARLGDVRVGRQPFRLAAVPALNRTFVSCSGSDEVSVIDVQQTRLAGSIRTESTPTCVAVDRDGLELYVGHAISSNLLIVDTRTLARLESFYVGNQVTAVLADRVRDRIYVARSNPPELVVVERHLRDAMRRVPLSAPVVNLAQPVDGALIYGAAPELEGLIAIDVVVGREESVIPCGAPITDVDLDN
jgi:YVTN family beta-propeller protein